MFPDIDCDIAIRPLLQREIQGMLHQFFLHIVPEAKSGVLLTKNSPKICGNLREESTNVLLLFQQSADFSHYLMPFLFLFQRLRYSAQRSLQLLPLSNLDNNAPHICDAFIFILDGNVVQEPVTSFTASRQGER